GLKAGDSQKSLARNVRGGAPPAGSEIDLAVVGTARREQHDEVHRACWIIERRHGRRQSRTPDRSRSQTKKLAPGKHHNLTSSSMNAFRRCETNLFFYSKCSPAEDTIAAFAL